MRELTLRVKFETLKKLFKPKLITKPVLKNRQSLIGQLKSNFKDTNQVNTVTYVTRNIVTNFWLEQYFKYV